MDPTSTEVVSWRTTVERALVAHEALLHTIHDDVNKLTRELSSLSSPPQPDPVAPQPPLPEPVSAPPPGAYSAPEPKLPPPDKYDGGSGGSRSFLTHCEIQFELQPSAFPTERAKVAYTLASLSGRAKRWATAEWARQADCCTTFPKFSAALKLIFDPANPENETTPAILNLSQGPRSVTDYIIEFRIAAADSGWNEKALVDGFYRGLSERMKDALVSHRRPQTLQALMDLVTEIDLRFRDRQHDRSRARGGEREPPRTVSPPPRGAQTTPPPDLAEPMQLGRSRLSPEERERRFRENLCLYCGRAGHRVNVCPLKGAAQRDPGGRC